MIISGAKNELRYSMNILIDIIELSYKFVRVLSYLLFSNVLLCVYDKYQKLFDSGMYIRSP